MTTPAAKWQRDRRNRLRAAGLVPVTVHIYPEARELLKRYVQRLNERTQRGRDG